MMSLVILIMAEQLQWILPILCIRDSYRVVLHMRSTSEVLKIQQGILITFTAIYFCFVHLKWLLST